MQKKLILMIIFVFLMIFVIGSAVGAMPLMAVTNPEENTRGYLQYVCQNDRFKFYITREDIARIVKSSECAKTGNFKIRVFHEFIDVDEKDKVSLTFQEQLEEIAIQRPEAVIKGVERYKAGFHGF